MRLSCASFCQIDSIRCVKGYRRLRARRMGHYVLIDVEVTVLPDLSLSSGLHVAAMVRHAVRHRVPEVAEALVHLHISHAEHAPDPSGAGAVSEAAAVVSPRHRPQTEIQVQAMTLFSRRCLRHQHGDHWSCVFVDY
jgi:hypothetical protein